MSTKRSLSHLHRSATFHHHPSSRSSQKHNIPFSPYISSTIPKDLQLHVFVDSLCRNRHNAYLGGYGIFAPLHSVRIAEPLPGRAQTSERAELRAMHAALELVHGIRARRATIHVHSTFVVNIFNNRLHQWETNRWTTSNGRFVRNRRLWKDVALLRNVFTDRGVQLEVKSRQSRSDTDMKVAYRLAKHGASLHVTCKLCRNTHGRQYLNHRCQPICVLDQCNGRVMKDVEAYSRHLYRRHRRVCERDGCDMKFECFTQEELDEHDREVHGVRIYSCDFCGRMYDSARRAKKHMKRKCKSAPYCGDCGKRFTSQRDFERHNVRKRSDQTSSSSDDDSDDDDWDDEARDGHGGNNNRLFENGVDEDMDESDFESTSESSDESQDEGRNPGLFMTDKKGRQWEIDEYGLRKRRGESASETFIRYGSGLQG